MKVDEHRQLVETAWREAEIISIIRKADRRGWVKADERERVEILRTEIANLKDGKLSDGSGD